MIITKTTAVEQMRQRGCEEIMLGRCLILYTGCKNSETNKENQEATN